MQVGDLVRYTENAFIGEVMPADYGVGVVIGVHKNYWTDKNVRVLWHNVKTRYNSVRETLDEKIKLEVISG